MDLSHMTAAAGTIELGGKTYFLSHPDIDEYGLLEAWIKERRPRPFAVVTEALLDLQPLREVDPQGYESMRRELMLAAQKDSQAPAGNLPQDVLTSMLKTKEGVVFCIWLLLHRRQPNLTIEDIKPFVTIANIETLKMKVNEVANDGMEEALETLANPPMGPAANADLPTGPLSSLNSEKPITGLLNKSANLPFSKSSASAA